MVILVLFLGAVPFKLFKKAKGMEAFHVRLEEFGILLPAVFASLHPLNHKIDFVDEEQIRVVNQDDDFVF